jgi:hypothetical protein
MILGDAWVRRLAFNCFHVFFVFVQILGPVVDIVTNPEAIAVNQAWGKASHLTRTADEAQESISI